MASLPTPVGTFATGVKFGPDGALYVASGSFDPTLEVAGVWRVSPTTGGVTLVANLAAGGFPNDIAFDRSGRIYVTDSFFGRIWRIDQAGNASVWLSHPALNGNPSAPVLVIHAFGANGITFDRASVRCTFPTPILGPSSRSLSSEMGRQASSKSRRKVLCSRVSTALPSMSPARSSPQSIGKIGSLPSIAADM